MTAPALTSIGVRHFVEETDVYRTGSGAQPIADMSPEHRLNAALLLLATAHAQARRFEAYARWDRRDVDFIEDPYQWMTTTPLFHALAAGLPRKRTPMVMLDERARHETSCPAASDGTCRCTPRPASHRMDLAVVMAAAGREVTR